jgi:hypothetical protein
MRQAGHTNRFHSLACTVVWYFLNHAVVSHGLFDPVNEPGVLAVVGFRVHDVREVKQPECGLA